MFLRCNPAHVDQNRFPVKPDLVCASKGNSFSGHFAQASAKIRAILNNLRRQDLKRQSRILPGFCCLILSSSLFT